MLCPATQADALMRTRPPLLVDFANISSSAVWSNGYRSPKLPWRAMSPGLSLKIEGRT